MPAIWNWKTAGLSATLRGTLFFAANLVAGLESALAAMATEFCFRTVTAGFFGACVQSMRHFQPRWAALTVVMVVIPLSAHTLEYTAHAWTGTPFLTTSILLSVALTILSTFIQFFVMRRDLFIVGQDARSLREDFRSASAMLISFFRPSPRLRPVGEKRRRPRKTLHITNCYHPSSGGIGTFYRAMMASANAAGREMRLVVPSDRTRIEPVGRFGKIYYLAAPRSPWFDRRYRLILPHLYLLPYASPLRRIILEEQPDLIEVCDKYFLVCLPSVLRKGWIAGAKRPVLVGMSCERMDDNVAAFIGPGRMARAFARWYMRRVYIPRFDYHVANSPYTAEEIRQLAPGRFRDRIFVRSMGVDLDAFRGGVPDDDSRRRLRALAGGNADAILLLYVGRLSPEKNPFLLIHMLGLLAAERDRDYRLMIVGAGPLQDRFAAEAKRLAPGRVLFKGHVESRQELRDLYVHCDALVHPNPREPFGIAPLEAMAAGLPVVAPAAGGVLSYLHADNSWLADPTPAAFAQAVRHAIRDREATRRKAAVARQTAEEFGWHRVTADLFALYDELVCSPSSARLRLAPRGRTRRRAAILMETKP